MSCIPHIQHRKTFWLVDYHEEKSVNGLCAIFFRMIDSPSPFASSTADRFRLLFISGFIYFPTPDEYAFGFFTLCVVSSVVIVSKKSCQFLRFHTISNNKIFNSIKLFKIMNWPYMYEKWINNIKFKCRIFAHNNHCVVLFFGQFSANCFIASDVH